MSYAYIATATTTRIAAVTATAAAIVTAAGPTTHILDPILYDDIYIYNRLVYSARAPCTYCISNKIEPRKPVKT